MGDFTVNVGIAYQIGAARGDYSVLSAMDIQEDELFAGFGQTINDLIMRHRDHLEKSARPGVSNEALTGVDSKAVAEPFARKNPGSMERRNIRYTLRAAESLSAGSVVQLFREVGAVVRSMLNFHRVAGVQLVANEEDAYRYVDANCESLPSR